MQGRGTFFSFLTYDVATKAHSLSLSTIIIIISVLPSTAGAAVHGASQPA